ncbi:carbonic anhydrase [Marasmius fiardii PR-910]|nr:carbonic anhydrase [Marasmius fiardii PR-910]
MFTKASIYHLVTVAVTVSANCVTARGPSDLTRRATPFHYSGTSLSGLLSWGFLDSTYQTYATGTRQSPIMIDNTIPMASCIPVMNIPTVDCATVEIVKHAVQVTTTGTTTFDGVEYHLRQFHFHTPSEHRINDEYYPLEMHMVILTDRMLRLADGNFVVFTILFELADGDNTELPSAVLQNGVNPNAPGKTGPLDLTVIQNAFATGSAYQYTGSLTAPRCTEGITFVILSQPLPVDATTYNALKKLMKYNARNLQNTLGSPNVLQIVACLFFSVLQFNY